MNYSNLMRYYYQVLSLLLHPLRYSAREYAWLLLTLLLLLTLPTLLLLLLLQSQIDEDDLDAELACLDDELAALDGIGEEEDAGGVSSESAPSYLQSSTLPAEPTRQPVSSSVDEYGLPVAPSRQPASQEQVRL
jgi:hypothetical protein